MKKFIILFLTAAIVFSSIKFFSADPVEPDPDDNTITVTPVEYGTVDKGQIEQLLKQFEITDISGEVSKVVVVNFMNRDGNIVGSDLHVPENVYIDKKHSSIFNPEINKEIVFRNITAEGTPTDPKRGDLLNSSTYVYPSGSMTVLGPLSAKVDLDYMANAETLSEQIGFDVEESLEFSDIQDVVVPKEGQTVTLRAYRNDIIYTFDIYDDDVFFDDYLGQGKLYKPVGMIFAYSINEAPNA